MSLQAAVLPIASSRAICGTVIRTGSSMRRSFEAETPVNAGPVRTTVAHSGRIRHHYRVTYAMTPASLEFSIALPRYQWVLGEEDGHQCLIPQDEIEGAPFTGTPGALARLVRAVRMDARGILELANTYTGLLSGDSPPQREFVWRWQLESYVLSTLLDLTGLRFAELERRHWARTDPLAPRRRSAREQSWADRATATLGQRLAELRPLAAASAPFPVLGHPEQLAAQWINATALEHWSVAISVAGWSLLPLDVRAATLAPLVPTVECKTLLGYMYAGLLVTLERRREFRRLSELWRIPGVDATPSQCRECQRNLRQWHPSGRKTRSDVKYCEECRRRRNTESQRNRRQAAM